ncbi:hypothetical protein BDN67DRAFT_1016790 [Paxillus ammoniavirescens]|nr:hypothetical protein BDN67DRAFT_1016790 [Paxillus ammoniavirescens]
MQRIEQIVSPTPHLTVMVTPLNGHGLLHITALAPLSVVIHLAALAPLSVVVRLTALTPLNVNVHLHLKRGRIDDDVDSNQFEEAVNTCDRVPVIKRA